MKAITSSYSDTPTLRHSDTPTLRHSDTPIIKVMNPHKV